MPRKRSSTLPGSTVASLEPQIGRPRMPKGYGVPVHNKGLLSWQDTVQKLEKSINYWVATTRPDGRPHVMPVWGLWVNGAFYFGGDRSSRKSRNLAANPAVVVHLESGNDVVIVEGIATEVSNREELEPVRDASLKKYGMAGGSGNSPTEVVYAVRPQVAFAWRISEFPKSATRWSFPRWVK